MKLAKLFADQATEVLLHRFSSDIGRREDRFRFRRRAVNLQSLWTGPDRAVAFFHCEIPRFERSVGRDFSPKRERQYRSGLDLSRVRQLQPRYSQRRGGRSWIAI